MSNNSRDDNDSSLKIRLLEADVAAAGKKLEKALQLIRRLQNERDLRNRQLQTKDSLLQNSLNQIDLMIKERNHAFDTIRSLKTVCRTQIDNIVDLLFEVIGSKCRQSRQHSRKVAEISVFIAGHFVEDKKEIRNIEIAALLHDIGKLVFPEDLAIKPLEACSGREADLMIQHPVKGAGCLDRFRGFEKVADIIRHYYENFDGTGVPDGLKGGEIPLGSRIIAAADMYDRLVYGGAGMPLNLVFEKIESMAGMRLDGHVVYYLHKYAHAHPVEEKERSTEIRIYDLEPGMTLAAGIFTANGAKLLPINAVLTEASIEKILHYNRIDPLEEIIYIR